MGGCGEKKEDTGEASKKDNCNSKASETVLSPVSSTSKIVGGWDILRLVEDNRIVGALICLPYFVLRLTDVLHLQRMRVSFVA